MKRLYPLLEGEPTGGAGKAPAAPPAAPPEPPKTLPLDILPPEMQGMSEQEIKFFLSRTLSGVKSTNEENKELKRRMDEMERQIRNPPTPAAPDPHADKSINELILEDAEAAIEKVARKKGWISAVEASGEKADEALFDTVANKMGPSFAEVEDEVKEVLTSSNAPVNRKSIETAYELVLGRKVREQRALDSRKAQNPENAKPAAPAPASALPEETALEKEIREAHGYSREAWEKYKNDEVEIKIPIRN